MARVGKYVLTGELGRGGHAVVSSGLDPVIGRPVALKVVERAHLAYLQGQAQAAGSLHHTNIVSIYEYGEDEQTAWVAMELVQGRSLAQHVAEGYRPPAEPLPEILVRLLEALDYAHGRGVVHGALSAQNVFIDPSGAPKIANFANSGDERADLAAMKALIREVIGDLPALEADHPSARALLDALKPRPATANVGALRRAIKSAAAPAAGEPPVSAPSRRRPAVLFVDDEERVLNALRGLFEQAYEVETATSGAQALELLKARRFLVIVSDQRMPEMTGVEFLARAKAESPGAVRILLTGYSDLAAIVGSVNEGEVFRFASKPWQQDELQATLAEAVDVAIAVAAAQARGRGAARLRGATLVMGDAAMARGLREVAGGIFQVLEAPDPAAALEVLAQQEVGVVVCELDAGGEDPAAFLRVLKEASPQTQQVVVSAAADAELVIGLVNEARIHRFLKKPVNLSLLAQAAGSALERYARLAAAPGMERAESAKRGKETESSRSLVARVRALGGRFARAIGGARR